MKPKIPIVIIYNEAGKIITDKLGIPVSKYIINFAYEYDETGEDDKATIQFMLSRENLDIIDNRYLDIDSIILIQWGYKDKLSPRRKVAIRDYESSYTDNGIKHILKCSDLVSYLKTTQTGGSIERLSTFAEYLSQIGRGKLNVLSEVDLRPMPGTYRGFLDVHDADSLDIIPRTHFLPDETQRAIDYLKKFAIVHPTGKSDYHNIKDNVESAEGNYTINGRDDNIIVKKDVKPNTAVVRAYELWSNKGDTIISFMPESNFKNNDIDIDQEVEVDPETGEVTIKGGSVIIDDKARRVIHQRETANAVAQPDQIAIQKPESVRVMSNSTFTQGDLDERENLILIEDEFIEAVREAADRTGSTGDIYILGDENNNFISKKVTSKPIPVSVLVKSPRLKKELNHLATNIIAKKEYKKRKMVLTVVGDPGIESDKAIWVSGGARKHNGKYYLQKVTHKINSQGFTTLMEGVKVNITSAGLRNVLKHLDGETIDNSEEYYKLLEDYIPKNETQFLEEENPDIEYGPNQFIQGTQQYQRTSTYETKLGGVEQPMPVSIISEPDSASSANYTVKAPEDS